MNGLYVPDTILIIDRYSKSRSRTYFPAANIPSGTCPFKTRASFPGREVEKNTAAAIIVTVHLSMYQKRVYPEPAGRAMPNITAAYSMASLVCGALNKTQPR